MIWSRVDRRYLEVPVTAKEADGSTATLTGVDITLLPHGARPAATTGWTAAAYVDGVARVLVAGPDAATDGALTLPDRGADVWLRVVDDPEIESVRVTRIDVR